MLELGARPSDSLAARPSAELRPLEPEDWRAVADIYWDGMRDGLATFETEVPSWEVWDGVHLHHHRLVAEILGEVVGFAALSPVSNRRCYGGIAENSVYVARDARGLGIGRALLEALIEGAEEAGVWTIQTSIFPENRASLVLHERCGFRVVGRRADSAAGRGLARHVVPRTTKRGDRMIKVEAVVIRERVETVIDAVEHATGHVGVTVIEAIGHGRQRGVTHEYRGRIFESRFLPKAQLTFIVKDELAGAVVEAIADSARSGNESGDGLVWTTQVDNVTHNRTGVSLEEVELA